MTQPLAYHDGRLLPQDQVRLPLHDAGLVWGATISDLCRTFAGRLFRWPNHLARFRDHCAQVGIELAVSDAELTEIASQLVAHNRPLAPPPGELCLVTLATPGPLGYYLGLPGNGPPTLILHTFPVPLERYRPLFTRGARLMVPAVRQIPPDCLDPRLKQRSRLHWWLAERQARLRDPDAIALLLDHRGRVTDTSLAGLLVVREGRVWTPRRGNVLDSISIRVAEEACQSLGVPFTETDLTLAEVQGAEEVLLAGTGFGVAGVSRVEGAAIPWPGPVFEQLLTWWSARVGVDIRAQTGD